MRRGGRQRHLSPRTSRQLLVAGASSAFPAGALRNTLGSISQLIPDDSSGQPGNKILVGAGWRAAAGSAAPSHLSDGSLKHLFRALVPLPPAPEFGPLHTPLQENGCLSNGGRIHRRRRRHLPEPLGLQILVSGGVWARGVQVGGHKTA